MQDELFDAQPINALRQWPPAPLAQAPDQALWEAFLASPGGKRLDALVRARLAAGAAVFPADPLRALRLTPLADVRVLILGQDPYHGPGQAQGLAFSVSPGTPVPPSLRNILKERARDLGSAAGPGPRDSLEAWAQQGVLLLNTVLTVEQGQAASHARQGWEQFTGAVVQALKDRPQSLVFMAWGAHAQALCQALPERHLLLCATHPSPLSATKQPGPFMGCGHFGQANAWLAQLGRKPIQW
jgi:uracil-DNA glycosylase